MNQDILDAITKSLPSMQVDALKAELKKAERVPDLEKIIAHLRECDANFQKTNSQQRQEIERLKKFEVDDLRIREEKRMLDVKILEIKLIAKEETLKAVSDLAHAAFRNPTVVKTFTHPTVTRSQFSADGSSYNEGVQLTEVEERISKE